MHCYTIVEPQAASYQQQIPPPHEVQTPSQKVYQPYEIQTAQENYHEISQNQIISPKKELKARFCPYCGEKILENARFCPGCGAKII